MRLSLKQVIDLHRREGQGQLSLDIKGHVDFIVRNEDGSIDQVVSKTNLTTELWLPSWLARASDMRYLRVFILPDDGGEMHPLKTAGRHRYPQNYEVYSYPEDGAGANKMTVNSSTKTWSFPAIFGQPSSNRSFRYIGLRTSRAQDTDGNARSANFIYAMTKLTSDISQATTQTLEAVYRISFTRV